MKIEKISTTENNVLLYELLDEHAIAMNHQADPGKEFSFGVYSEGSYIGGITGKLWHQEFHLNLLVLKSAYRGTGIGKILLTKAETFAKQNGARVITVTTQDFQAPIFYQKCGYHVFAQLENCPFVGTTRFYLSKDI